jgi:hypothetical protein
MPTQASTAGLHEGHAGRRSSEAIFGPEFLSLPGSGARLVCLERPSGQVERDKYAYLDRQPDLMALAEAATGSLAANSAPELRYAAKTA